MFQRSPVLDSKELAKKAHRIEIEGTPGSAPFGLLKQVQESINSINRIYAGIEAPSPEVVVEKALFLTKVEPTDEEMAKAFISVAVHELITSDFSNWDIEGIARKSEFLKNWWAKAESDRQKFRGRLEDLIANPENATDKHLGSDQLVLRRDLLLIPWRDNRNTVRHRYFPMTIEAAYIHALTLLQEDNFNRLNRVIRCPGCGAYFLRKVSPYGGAPQKHCSTKCRRKPDHKKALIRQAKPDQRKKQAERKRKYREESKK